MILPCQALSSYVHSLPLLSHETGPLPPAPLFLSWQWLVLLPPWESVSKDGGRKTTTACAAAGAKVFLDVIGDSHADPGGDKVRSEGGATEK
eukprot:337521-Hanusia_phi.AAC.1